MALEIRPDLIMVGIGGTAPARALARFSDQSLRDVTTAATWSTEDAEVAAVQEPKDGKVPVEGRGTAPACRNFSMSCQTTLTARYAGLGATAVVMVSLGGARGGAPLELSPANPGAQVAESVRIAAFVSTPGQPAKDVTDAATWESGDTNIATLGGPGMFACKVAGVVEIRAKHMGASGRASLTCGVDRRLVGLSVQPATLTLAADEERELAAIAVYADGTAVDVSALATWTSSASKVATVDAGTLTAEAAGAATVSATYMGQKGSAAVTVSAAQPIGLEVDPPSLRLRPQQEHELMAAFVYKDGARRPLDDADAWTSSDSNVASVDADGTLTARLVGTATITVRKGALHATTKVVVTTAAPTGLKMNPGDIEIRVGGEVSFRASAQYADGISADVSEVSIWTSSDPKIAVVDTGAGTVRGLAPGTATIKATYMNVSDVVTVTVAAPQPKYLQVSPAMALLSVGEVIWYQAVLVYDDGGAEDVTDGVEWHVSNTLVAEMDDPYVTALAPGTTTIRAAFRGLTGAGSLSVSDARVKGVSVQPQTASVGIGKKQVVSAVATFDDGTTRDVTAQATWATSDPAIAVVTNGSAGLPGVVSGLAVGTAQVSASYQGRRGSATVTVTP